MVAKKAVKKAARKSGDTSRAKEWKRLEKQFSNALGKASMGGYPAELEPRGMSFEHAFDPSPLLPPDYLQFVKELGYRWITTGETALGFLPPRWMLNLSQQMGEPGRKWEAVRAEREAGTHTYRFVMFASRDINDVNGYCFGKSEDGDALVVWNVEDSLPESELGPFSTWLEQEMQALGEALSELDEEREDADDEELGEPLGLEGESLEMAVAVKLPKKGGAEGVLAAFSRTEKELTLNGRKLGTLPASIGEFSELERLWLGSTGLKQLPGELGRLGKLKRLDLSFNRELRSLPPEVGQLQALESLNLKNTGLTSLPEELGRLERLTFLDLQATELKSLPACLFQMKSLKTLDLYWTPIPPEEIERLRQALPDCKVGTL
ncbi:leucine-rich repeat domain-containing protein [Cystobacter ferrugineus]|uniref:leucine-rich repeat domain-containing protein n=1 Tax=Cystobacter ferrugineus TaxID=83449 RepID=UPI000A8CFB65|nr:leucine-rich repeat domain-containing protein [Cystobacter ferrugineus]